MEYCSSDRKRLLQSQQESDKFFPRSLNYGGIGVVIGHEITHGFDDKGRLFDKDGNLHRWWKDEAINGFHRRAQCLIDQYARYTITEVEMQIDGVNTQGENIADNGGIKQAFRAYERWLHLNEEEDETLPGMSATDVHATGAADPSRCFVMDPTSYGAPEESRVECNSFWAAAVRLSASWKSVWLPPSLRGPTVWTVRRW
ncbi:neprilysin-4-like isoform X2 [Polyergus mexicanus]|uniref:neprilysin-4-like isoform X2 n=1 Tax=Polyergus mexicanus TaxID=615972 RepID=UPI0038B46550